MKQYVVIGNGVAAAGCIEGIRNTDKDGKITVISEEKYPVYCRPLISYYLEGKTDTEKMNYRAPDYYEKMGCEVLYGKKAAELLTDKKKVVLDDSTELPYDSVCVATGSSPFVPPFEGLDTVENKFSFMTLDDTLSLEKKIDKNSRVLIVGAGLIGLKCAEGLKDRVKSITVCDLADRVLSSILGSECAGLVQTHLENNGISFMLSDTAAKFEGNKAFMKSGKTVEFDVLVLAVGVKAQVSLVKNAGGEVGRGIIVDTHMRTSLENVYSAGDCTEGDDITFGAKRVLAILPNACMQGNCAGKNMAGEDAVFDNAIPMNSIGFFGLHIMSAGSYGAADDKTQLYEEKEDGCIKKFYVKDGLLTGFMLIGKTERAGIYTSLIRERTPLESVDFEMLKKIATSAAFSSKKRGKMFGGVV